jgi:hypothetical protein
MLRFQQQGAALAPDLVVFGFQAENLKRNRNLLRPLYDPRSGLPFAKPRFNLDDQGIRLINVPVLPPDRLAATLRDIDDWELRPHEYFYDPEDFQGSWWQHSKLLATVVDLKVKREDHWLLKRIIFEDNGDEQQLGWAVTQAFSQEVAAAGSRFMIVHLPSHQEMELRAGLGRWSYQRFLDALDGSFEVVHPEDELIRAAANGGYEDIFAGHYNKKGNRIIAEKIFSHLTE